MSHPWLISVSGIRPTLTYSPPTATDVYCRSFGDIYLGIGQNGEQVAVKFEKHSTRCPQLRHEYKVYRELQNCAGFGRVRTNALAKKA